MGQIFSYKKEAPTLEKSASSHCELHIDSLNNQKKLVYFIVHMKNIGKISFDVDSVQILLLVDQYRFYIAKQLFLCRKLYAASKTNRF